MNADKPFSSIGVNPRSSAAKIEPRNVRPIQAFADSSVDNFSDYEEPFVENAILHAADKN